MLALHKFYDVHVLQASLTTTEALARIGALYGIEEEVRGKPPARSATRCRAGRRLHATSMMACWRLTIPLPEGRSVPSPW
jgi:hypothetical protein